MRKELQRFEKITGYKPNLEEPKTFCEKLEWRKLNVRDEMHPIIADKIKVRELVPDELLIDAEVHYGEIKKKHIPFPSVVKLNNASGRNKFFINRKPTDADVDQLNKWLHSPYGESNKEWEAVYKHIKPGFLIEKEILPLPHYVYRFNVFHGKTRFIHAYSSTVDDKGFKQLTVSTYTPTQWKKIPVQLKGLPNPDVEKPEELNEMRKIVHQLTFDQPYVRVDLYNIDGRIIFNEVTLYPLSCKIKIDPIKYDHIWGEYL